jgi:hypothetical protein
MAQPVSNSAKRERLRPGYRLISGSAIDHATREIWNFRGPTPSSDANYAPSIKFRTSFQETFSMTLSPVISPLFYCDGG